MAVQRETHCQVFLGCFVAGVLQLDAEGHFALELYCQRMLSCGVITATYLLKLVFRTVQTDPSCVQEMQGTPVRVMLHRTFRCRHFSQATEARERREDITVSSNAVGSRWRREAPPRSRYLGELNHRRIGAKQIEPRCPKKHPFQFVTQAAR